VTCTSDDDFCTGDTTALVCNTNGVGFMMKTCPANTHCVDNGQCAGSCTIGDSFCFDATTKLSCDDGFTYTPTPCASGEVCSDAAGGVCLAAPCSPADACQAVCGNKATDPNSTDANFFSLCTDTPQGWQWLSVGCSAP